jgi:hypothetical protein
MTTQDTLNISLSIGFLVLVGFFCYAFYYLAQTLKSAKKIIDDAQDLTKDVRIVKNQLKSNLGIGLNTFMHITNLFFKRKGGGKNDR